MLDELIEEVLLRIPPDEPACLFRASAVCKPWRRILAGRRFRRRYREFHGTPPILGLFHQRVRFVPTSALRPAHSGLPDWFAMDCRHGRALFAHIANDESTLDLIVLDPVTGHQRRVPWPHDDWTKCSAAVLCAAQGCDHHSCQDGHFLVAFVVTKKKKVSLGWLYSSETRVWSNLTSVHHPNVKFTNDFGASSVLLGDALYFNGGRIMECQLGTLRLSSFEKPIDRYGILMTAEDGGLGFAAVVDVTNLTLWSREAGPEGAMGWTPLRVIDLKMLLPDVDLSIRSFETTEYIPTFGGAIYEFPCPRVSGFAEGTHVIFVTTSVGSYMVDLKTGRASKVSDPGRQFFPFMSFYIPGTLLCYILSVILCNMQSKYGTWHSFVHMT
uniref:F-box domain-containing protein n=1 Tax=Aegilops tauschii subsp. strangulata TaxID=200361 RepID=A0A453M4X2_AEGTS